MASTRTRSCSWYRALTLAERPALTGFGPTGEDPERAAVAVRKLQRWQGQFPFDRDGYFERRLAIDRLDVNGLLRLLGERPEDLAERLPTPGWSGYLEATLAGLPAGGLPPANPADGFLSCLEALVAPTRERLERALETLLSAHPGVPVAPDELARLLFERLPSQLAEIADRTLALEMQVCALRQSLAGATPEERFRDYVERLRKPEPLRALLEEYPVLARQVLLRTEQWEQASLEFARHLCSDWDALQAGFGLAGAGSLVQITGNLSDRHRDGRQVLVAVFASGLRLVYKPRSLAVELHFQELLAWFNDRGDHPPLRTLTVLDRDDHGWVEFVQHTDCPSIEQVPHFYTRLGACLALLYALHATDFHFENLIAAGANPVLVDLETLFHIPTDPQAEDGPLPSFAHTVLTTGMLPMRMWASERFEGVDISGIGAQGNQKISFRQWEETGTDRMRFVRTQGELSSQDHLPTIAGRPVNPAAFLEPLSAGFADAFRLLVRHREELLAPGGPVERFADDRVRLLARPTRTYALLLREGFHPDRLGDGLERERLFDRLWVGASASVHLEMLIDAERAALHRGDIPAFTTRPDSQTVWSDRDTPVGNHWSLPGLELARRQIRQMDEADLARQLWCIRAAFVPLIEIKESSPPPDTDMGLAKPAELITAARRIGDRLEQLAFHDKHPFWINLRYTDDGQWSLLPTDASLYRGLGGLALFLGHLGAITGEERFTILARRAILAAIAGEHAGPGGFDGWGGTVYALAHLGALWDEPQLYRKAQVLLERSSPLETVCDWDIMSGLAGGLMGLLALEQAAPGGPALELALRTGKQLVAAAQPQTVGRAWSNALGGRPWAGLGHGAAGIAMALAELAAISGRTEFRTAALDAVAYERTLYCPEGANWFDLRKVDRGDEEPFTVAWCHGAPGVGLARARLVEHFEDESLRDEVAVACATTLRQGFGRGHSLCHGDLGNLELFLAADRCLPAGNWREQALHQASRSLAEAEATGWRCGIPGGAETPGLMLGLAGIGFGLLRLALPEQVPSLLVLAPPKSGH